MKTLQRSQLRRRKQFLQQSRVAAKRYRQSYPWIQLLEPVYRPRLPCPRDQNQLSQVLPQEPRTRPAVAAQKRVPKSVPVVVVVVVVHLVPCHRKVPRPVAPFPIERPS